jgi:hypothetical protein
MPKVFGLHEVVLPPGMTAEEYEQLFGKELTSLPDLQGWKTYLLKGDRGDRAGKLLLMFEIESVEARDRYFPRPRPGGESEEFRQFQEQHPEVTAASEKPTGFLVEPHSWTERRDLQLDGAPTSR